MNFTEICNERYSVRSFSAEKVEESKVNAMLNMARLAPTAMNGQPYADRYERAALRNLRCAKRRGD